MVPYRGRFPPAGETGPPGALVGAAAPLAVALYRADRRWWPLAGAAWGLGLTVASLAYRRRTRR
ncbi:hypothetical protein [Plantactinospora sp. KLBMP9567]|uniref:hypothetical protein n=1 Tax=Plantactinospora sp. KLBMP9567 TaxID=3085900 RepID=UPI0029810385|nr:hypothetical protein [Plantactinospora sp. KLBMP9567]MDW5329745.1 hypothetical protein [Plantactinospora sp. KLBMP9567]